MTIRWERLARETVFEGRVLELRRDRIRLVADGRESESVYDVVHHRGAAAVVALFEDDTVALLRQFRYPVEETIWSKAFIMERERYDGADVAHLLRCRGKQLDWRRLLDRFGTHWPVLMSYLVLYGFIYPDSQDQIPEWVRTELVGRWLRAPTEETQPAVCNGTLLSREQFLSDLEFWKYRDARQPPHGSLSESDIDRWTPGSGA